MNKTLHKCLARFRSKYLFALLLGHALTLGGWIPVALCDLHARLLGHLLARLGIVLCRTFCGVEHGALFLNGALAGVRGAATLVVHRTALPICRLWKNAHLYFNSYSIFTVD